LLVAVNIIVIKYNKWVKPTTDMSEFGRASEAAAAASAAQTVKVVLLQPPPPPPHTKKWAKPMYLMCGAVNCKKRLHVPHAGYAIEQSADFVVRSAGTNDVFVVLVHEQSGEVASPVNMDWNIKERICQEFARMHDAGIPLPTAFMLQAFSKTRSPLQVVVGVLRGYNPYYDAFCAVIMRIAAGPQYVQYAILPASVDAGAAFAALKICTGARHI
jgi:hypothetical protein